MHRAVIFRMKGKCTLLERALSRLEIYNSILDHRNSRIETRVTVNLLLSSTVYLNPLSPTRDQHQFSPYSIITKPRDKWLQNLFIPSPKGKCFDLWEILTTFTVHIYLCLKLSPHYFVNIQLMASAKHFL